MRGRRATASYRFRLAQNRLQNSCGRRHFDHTNESRPSLTPALNQIHLLCHRHHSHSIWQCCRLAGSPRLERLLPKHEHRHQRHLCLWIVRPKLQLAQLVRSMRYLCGSQQIHSCLLTLPPKTRRYHRFLLELQHLRTPVEVFRLTTVQMTHSG